MIVAFCVAYLVVFEEFFFSARRAQEPFHGSLMAVNLCVDEIVMMRSSLSEESLLLCLFLVSRTAVLELSIETDLKLLFWHSQNQGLIA